jgi:dTDP-4-dehydrorhamnose 3,5-epimerase
MQTTQLELRGLILISPTIHRDARGFFIERFNLEQFWGLGLPTQFVQDNHSRSLPGVLRGLHFQRSPAQSKLVGVTHGVIWDVVVDLRLESPTFGKSVGMKLNAENGQMLWVPAGCAHGFCVLGTEPADVFYKTDSPYQPSGEAGIRWDDADLAIAWPIRQPLLSERDQKLGSFADYQAQPIRWADEVLAGKEQDVLL